MSLAVELLDECTPPEEATVERVGRKAHELVVLAHCARSGAFTVPRFRILPAHLSRAFHEDAGYPTSCADEAAERRVPLLDFPELPAPYLIAPDVERHYLPFADRSIKVIDQAVAEVGGQRVVLRSSIATRAPLSASLAGVNFTIYGASSADGNLHSGVARLLAAMWRPYAEWYLGRFPHTRIRDAAVMVCEMLPTVVSGTAYVHQGHAAVEYGGGATSEMPIQSRLFFDLTDPATKWPQQWRSGRGERLREALAEVSAHCGAGSSPIEVEFGFDQSGRLIFFQHRIMPGLAVDGAPLALRHTPGSVTGELVSLADRPRTPSALMEAMATSSTDRIWAVHQIDNNRWDGFALMWYMWRRFADAPLRVVLCYGPAIRRSHLVSAMHEHAAVEFLAQLPLADVASLGKHANVTITSDGSEVTVTSGQTDPTLQAVHS